MIAVAAQRVVRGLYAVTPGGRDTDRLVREVTWALEGGARIIQYRDKTGTRATRLCQARALAELCKAREAALIVNDDVELAHSADAAGVHLGADDASLASARETLGAGKLIGISCYASLDFARLAQAQGADYVAFGSFFHSRVKPGAVRAPLELLSEAKRELHVPIVAIGGITSDNGAALVAAGADALAVISAVFASADVKAAAGRIAALFDRAS